MIDIQNSKNYKAIFIAKIIRPGILSFIKWISLFITVFSLVFHFAGIGGKEQTYFLGISFIFFSIFSASTLLLSFYNQKLKNPPLKETEENLFDFLDLDAAKIVLKALSFKKYSFNLSLFLLLLGRANLKFTFDRFLLSQENVFEEVESLWKKEGIDLSDSLKDAESLILNALNITDSLGRERISIFHLLMALCQTEPLLTKILIKFNISKDDLYHVVAWQESLEVARREEKKFWTRRNLRKKRPLARNWTAGYTPFLDEFVFDISESLRIRKPSSIILHEKEINQLEDALVREGDNCAVLVGEVGSGRKTLIYNFARKCLEEKSYPSLNFSRVLELSLTNIFSASSTLEEVEMNLQNAFVEATNAGNVILVIKDIENYIGILEDKQAVTKVDISGILSEFIAYPTFRLIGITTPQGYQKAMTQGSIIMNRLVKIEVPPATSEETLLVLEEAVLPLERETKLLISFPALKEIINFSDRFIGDVPFPKKAVDLLNDIFIYKLRKRDGRVILPQDVAEFVSQKFEVPVGAVEEEEKEILLNLEELLHKRLIDQEEAVSEVANALRRARADIQKRKRTLGNFLFLGPTGVGKTETAKALARVYFKSEKRIIRLDMSEYQEISSIERLIGSATEPGYLTKKVREDPFSLVLLDEIEKAHPDILNLFLQVLDEGRLTDGSGRIVDFKNTIIIATSNAGADLIREAIKQGKDLQSYKDEFMNDILKRGIFRPEFLNRFDAVVLFKTLSKDDLKKIANLMLNDIREGLLEKNIDFQITEDLIEKIAEIGFNPEFGAREMRRVLQQTVENNIAKAIIANQIKPGDCIKVDAETFEVSVVKGG